MLNQKIFNQTSHTIEEFLNNNARRFPNPEFHYGVDTGQQKAHEFDEKKLNILMVCLSDGPTRAVSSTFNAVSHIARQRDRDNIFVDFCYYPEDITKDIMIENDIPWMFGNATHRPYYDFDVITVSLSVLPELFHLPRILKHSGIPYTIQQRFEDRRIPLMIMGGAAISESSIILGDVKDDNGKVVGNSMADWVCYGYAEGVIEPLMEKLLKLKQSGFDLRNKKELEEMFIEEKFLYRKIFYTDKYKWHYADDKFTITEIECLDERLPKTVDFNRMVGDVPYSYVEKFYDLGGYNSDGKDLMIAYGCTGQSSSCSFSVVKGTRITTSDGIFKIEDIVGKRNLLTEKYVSTDYPNYLTDIVETKPSGNLYKITLSNGMVTTIDEKHLCQIIDYDMSEERTVYASDLKVGDYFHVKLGSDVIPEKRYETIDGFTLNESMCELIGLIQGDGHITKELQVRLYLLEKQLDNAIELLQDAGLNYSQPRIHYKSDSVSLYEIVIDRKQNFGEFLINIGVPRLHNDNVVPEPIWRLGKSCMRAYISGVIESDGWVTKDVGLTAVSHQFLLDIQKLFLILGVPTVVRKRNRIYHRPDGSEIRPTAYLRVYPQFSNKFLQEIKLVSKKKDGFFRLRNRNDIPIRSMRYQFYETLNANYTKKERRNMYHYMKSNGISQEFLSKLKHEFGMRLPRVYDVLADFRYFSVQIVDISIEPAPDGTIMYSTNSIPYHRTNYDLIYSHNCCEGTTAGYYIDRPLEKMVEDMEYSQKYYPTNGIHFHSFNLNYYYRFQDLIYEAAKKFAKIGLQNERMDIIAHSEEQVETAKFFGVNRMSLAIEGVSEKIRNKFLNKNLPHATLIKAMDILYKQKLMHMKCVTGDTLILTANRGYVPAKNINMDDILYDRDGKQVNIVSIAKNKPERVITIETKHNLKIRGQRDHRVLVKKTNDELSWIELKDLKDSHRVKVMPIRANYDIQLGDMDYINSEYSQFASTLYDKSLFPLLSIIHITRNQYGFSIRNNFGQIDFLNKFVENALNRLKIKYRSFCFTTKIDYLIDDKHFIDFLDYLGVGSDDFYNYIETSTTYIYRFLKSIFSLYGYKSIYKKDNNIFRYFGLWYLPQQINIEKVRHLLFIFGFLSSYDENNHRLSIESSQIIDYINDIGFISDKTEIIPEEEISLLIESEKQNRDKDFQKIISKYEHEELEETYAIQTESGSLITNGIVSHNCGIILTGYETEEDIQEFSNTLKEFDELRKKHGASTSFQVNVTPLVHYTHTAICYLPRKMAVASFNREKTGIGLIDAVKNSIGGRIKFHSKGYGTYAEQMLIDFGPAGTNYLIKATDYGVSYEHLSSLTVKDKILKALHEEGYDDPLFFTYERPDDWIFPADHVDAITPYNKKRYIEFKKTLDIEVRMCLETQANEKPRCHGCSSCSTPQDIKNMVRRNIYNETNIHDFMNEVANSKTAQVVRVVCTPRGNYDILNKKALSFCIFKEFTRLSDKISKNFYMIGENSSTWNGSHGAKAYFSGQFWFNVHFRHHIEESDMTSLIEQVNSNLESVRVDKIIFDTNYSKKNIKEFNISYLGMTDKYTFSYLKEKLTNFDGVMKVAVRVRGGGIIERQHIGEHLKDDFLISHKGNQVFFHIYLPSELNPYLLMSTLTRQSELETFNQFRFKVLDMVVPVDANCSCGRHMTFSLNKNEYNKQCPYCTAKAILYKLSHN